MARRRFKPEMIRTVPVRWIKTGDTIVLHDEREVVVEDKKQVGDHYTLKYKGRDHYYGPSSKVQRLENPV